VPFRFDSTRRHPGKEAAAMRKALFVVALIGLSFGAGAAFNGTGPAWVRALLHRNAKAASADDTDAPDVVDSPAAEAIPAAPLPPLSSDAPAKAASAAAPVDEPPPDAPTSSAKNDQGEAPTLAPPGTEPVPARDQPVKTTETPPPASDKADDVPAPPPPSPAPTAPLSSGAGSDPAPPADNGWGDAPGSAPATAVVPGRSPTAKVDTAVTQAILASPAGGPNPAVALGTWAAVRRRLRDLGVSRYWVEGEPNGPARFRCVIPLAGQRAVGQQFEGEGDDDLQAAEAALRRVALWRATQAR
jgi:hypothetical protein